MDIRMIGLAAAAYLLGGIPSGYLIAKRVQGIDIREHGSGNPGAANVYRVVGRWAGWATLVLDALKGYLPVMVAKRAYPDHDILLITCGTMAILGHIWTVFLRFRGGKGVATSCGVFAALLPVPTLAAFAVFAAGVALSGHISVGSILASLSLPLGAWWTHAPPPMTAMASAVAALILVKHIPNIRRLLGERELPFQAPAPHGSPAHPSPNGHREDQEAARGRKDEG